jgi:uncharacterized protein YegP (UPF0339 family)/menaquinone-dependent protoporphyrinogen IX oxidase
MSEKTLIVYSTKTGINSDAAHTMAEVLEKTYDMEVTVADLKDGKPDIAPYKNIIVGGGVDNKSVYGDAVDFLGETFDGKSVALYFSCEDSETPKEQSTKENSERVLVKNVNLKPVDAAGFGGCVIKQGKPAMDDLNVFRVKEWAVEVGKKFGAKPRSLQEPCVPEMHEGSGIFEILCDASGKFRFHLKAANGEIIAASQAYESRESAMNGIASIQRNAPLAKIVDLTKATVPL